MKHILQILQVVVLLSFISIVETVFAQQKPYSVEWSKCYGGSRNENQGGGAPYRNSILPTDDGGYVLAGVTTSIDGDIDVSKRHDDMFPQDSFRNEDIWIVKLSNSGSIEWEQYYGGEGTDLISSIKSTSDGGYILCGSTASFKGDFPMDTTGIYHIIAKSAFPDGFVMKLDSLGRKEWVSRIGGSDSDQLTSVIQTSDGGYITTGNTFSTDEIWLDLSWISNFGKIYNGFVAKLNSDGTKKWSRLYGGTGRDYLNGILEKHDGNFLLCGNTNSEDGNVSKLHYKDSIHSMGATEDAWLVEISANGNIIREKCFGGSGVEGGLQIDFASDGGYIILSATVPENPPALIPNGDVVGYHPQQTGLVYEALDSWIIKIDTAWNIVWQNCIGGSQQDVIHSIISTRNGGYAFIGITNSSDSDLTGIHNPEPKHNWDIWAGELSSTGKLLWQQCFGGTARDYGNGIVENDEGGFTIYSCVGSMDGDIVGNHGGEVPYNSDIWIAKLKKQQNGVEVSLGGSHFANPYPNPSVNEMNLYIHPTQPVQTVQFFNPLGQEFYPKYQLSGNLLTTDTRILAKGMYIIRITYQDLTVQEVRKFVKVD